jgi:DNA-binding NtrC family response regulator
MKKKILITDDDPGIQDVFRIILEKAGYDVRIYSNGSDLMEQKRQNKKKKTGRQEWK